MSKPLVIYGAGGLGREVKSMLPHVSQAFRLIGFLDDGVEAGTVVDQYEVLGGTEWLVENKSTINLILAIGDPKVKSRIINAIKDFDHISFPILVHQQAHIQEIERVKLGRGTIICAGVVLTTSIEVGEHVLLNLNVTVGHDTTIGNQSSIMPGVNIAGNVCIGTEVMIGSGANIINNIKVGNFSTIGAGSVVNHDIGASSTAAGVPARVIKQA